MDATQYKLPPVKINKYTRDDVIEFIKMDLYNGEPSNRTLESVARLLGMDIYYHEDLEGKKKPFTWKG